MSSRFYLCKILGNGDDTEPEYDAEGRDMTPSQGYFRHALNQPMYAGMQAYVSEIERRPNGSMPPYVLCVAETNDHRKLRNDPFLRAIPVMPLGIKYRPTVAPQEAQEMYAAFQACGLSTAPLNNTLLSVREVLQLLGSSMYAGFDIHKLELDVL